MGLFSLKNSNISNPLVFSIGYGFDYKRTTIESKRSKNIKLENIGHAITLDVRKRFLQKHEIYARLSSFDDYYFPEFFTPYYTVGYSLDISKKITLGAVGSVRYTDQFTLNGVLEGFQARIFASYKW